MTIQLMFVWFAFLFGLPVAALGVYQMRYQQRQDVTELEALTAALLKAYNDEFIMFKL